MLGFASWSLPSKMFYLCFLIARFYFFIEFTRCITAFRLGWIQNNDFLDNPFLITLKIDKFNFALTKSKFLQTELIYRFMQSAYGQVVTKFTFSPFGQKSLRLRPSFRTTSFLQVNFVQGRLIIVASPSPMS